MVGSGKADVHAGLFYSEERDRFLDYGEPFSKTDTHFFSHVSLPPVEEISSLTAYRVGVIKGDYVEGFLKERLPEGNVLPFPDYNTLMNALREGILKVFAADTPTGLFHLEENGLLADFNYISEKPLYRNDFFFAVREGNQTLVEMINQGMSLITDEEKQNIQRTWIAAGSSGDALLISISRSFEPLAFINALGRPSGLCVDMWRTWARETGRQIEFKASGWSETLESLRAGEVDIRSGLSFSDERSKWMDFSTQIYQTYTRIYHRLGDRQPENIEGYENYVVGTQFGTYMDAAFRGAYPNVRIRNYSTGEDLVNALLRGEIKAVVHEALLMKATLDLLGLRGEVTVRTERLFPNTIHAGVLEGNAELLQEINDGFAAIDREELYDLEKRWISEPGDRFFKPDAADIQADAKVELTENDRQFLDKNPEIVLGTLDLAPYSFRDANGRATGLVNDYL